MREDQSPRLQAAIASLLAFVFGTGLLTRLCAVPRVSPASVLRASRCRFDPVKWSRGESNPRANRVFFRYHQHRLYLVTRLLRWFPVWCLRVSCVYESTRQVESVLLLGLDRPTPTTRWHDAPST